MKRSQDPSGISLSGDSISDSNIHWRNWMILNKGPHETAVKVWKVGQYLGLKDKGNSDEIVSRLETLEQRDRVASGRHDEALRQEVV